MTGWIVNWFALILVVIVPGCVIAGMAAVLIHDHIKAKRRDKRCHQRILNWWEMEVK
jgi:hypothetical protein